MSRAHHPADPGRAWPVTASLEGERIGADALRRIQADCSDPDALLRLVLRAAALDGWTVPAGPALRGACRVLQKHFEHLAPKP